MQKYNPTGAPMPWQWFHPGVVESRDLVLKGIGLTQRKKLSEKCIGAFLPG
jgi:hypothetical protein